MCTHYGEAGATVATVPLIAAPSFQDEWGRCVNCDVLFFNGYPLNKGVCPARGPHLAEKRGLEPLTYRLVYDDSTGPGQGDWRFCRKCFALFFSYYPTRGVCPVDDKGHDAAGYNFFLYHDRPAGVHEEPNWRYCRNCQGLFRTANVQASVCPANRAPHVPAGFHFVVGQPAQRIDG
jgi:hypothetical protein